MSLDDLYKGKLYRFADWRTDNNLPTFAPGVYTIWRGEEFLYVGMAGAKLTAEHIKSPDNPKEVKGLKDRLNSHQGGRRSGDQFCVYICDRFVVPNLIPPEPEQIANGTLLLDTKTKKYIHEHLAYRYLPTPDGKTAVEIEEQIRLGEWAGPGKPLLNPKEPKQPRKPRKPRKPNEDE